MDHRILPANHAFICEYDELYLPMPYQLAAEAVPYSLIQRDGRLSLSRHQNCE